MQYIGDKSQQKLNLNSFNMIDVKIAQNALFTISILLIHNESIKTVWFFLLLSYIIWYSIYIIKMNSKISKSIKLKKPLSSTSTSSQQETGLKNQTSKIQDKLQSLKAEIAMRKTMKNKQQETQTNTMKLTSKSNTATTWNVGNKLGSTRSNMKSENEQINKFLLSSNNKKGFNSQQISEERQRLQNLLQELKMQQFIEVITNKYSIEGLDRMLETTQQQIDGWKDIPVGYRVKLKKIIKEHSKNKNEIENANEQNKKQENIEDIIKRRKNQREYEPIMDKKIEEQEYEELDEQNYDGKQKQEENGDDEQDILISSLNTAFKINCRKGIIKKSDTNIHKQNERKGNSQNKVHWDKNVREYNRETSKFRGEVFNTKYPHNQILQKIQQQEKIPTKESNQDIKPNYCWNCLKKITQPTNNYSQQTSDRAFCGSKCRETYNNSLSFKEIESSQVERVPTEQKKKQNVWQQQIDELDLDIL